MTKKTSMIAALAAGILGFDRGMPAILSRRVRQVRYSFGDTLMRPSPTKRYASKKLREMRRKESYPRKMQRSSVSIREKACGKHWAKSA